jgi:hypothetical protein
MIVIEGGDSPLWSPGVRELFYRNGNSVFAVPVETIPEFKPGKATKIFSGPYVSSAVRRPGIPFHNTWDIHTDGDRFLMIKEPGSASDKSSKESPRQINVIINWFEELKEKVPVQ